MDTIERVARAICAANGGEPSAARLVDGSEPLWTVYIKDAQAAIDAMQLDIAEADRKAREECARIVEEKVRLIDGFPAVMEIRGEMY
jgi:hypothetical protein